MRRKSGFKYVIYHVLGGLISFVCRRRNWSGSQDDLLEVYGVVLL